MKVTEKKLETVQTEEQMGTTQGNETAIDNEKWETVYVAPGTGKDKSTIFVGVNGKGYYVPRGKSVQVPPEVAEVLRNREKQLAQAEEYSDSVSNGD